jgi:hypothetical protein
MGPINNSAIADTVAAVFHSHAFVVHNTVSIGQLIAAWIWNILMRLLGFAASHPVVGLVLRLALGFIGLIVLARIIYGLIARYAPSAIARRHFDVSRGTDWWATAQSLAARDDYTGAAHALYLALIGSAARGGLVSLHESKTTGDYLREIRRAHGAADVPRFADFTHSYETVIYGIGTCDRERYTYLNTLASAFIDGVSSSRGGVRLAIGVRS